MYRRLVDLSSAPILSKQLFWLEEEHRQKGKHGNCFCGNLYLLKNEGRLKCLR